MGMHRIEITMVGGHGCDRVAKAGELLAARCGRSDCPDCAAAELVAKFRGVGAFSHEGTGATITHWPGQPGEVVDDLVTGTRRSGEFGR